MPKNRKTFIQKINELDKIGKKWIGFDGLLNMETFALIVIFFMIFFNPLISVFTTFIISLIKCYHDEKKGHLNEKHDLICAGIGIVFGCILGIAI